MILAYKGTSFDIPFSSTCIIHTKGVINNGDVVSVTSPIFTSNRFTSGAINMSDRFDVPVKIEASSNNPLIKKDSDNLYIYNDSNEGLKATLICSDDDIFNMYVLIK